MTVRFTLKANADTRGLDNAIKEINRIGKIVEVAGNKVTDSITPGLLAELGQQPPRRSYPNQYPIEWTSDKQRKAYFATDGFSKGIPYNRSGVLVTSWVIVGKRIGNGYAIVVENKLPASRYVVGTLAKDLKRASAPQQLFHKITGWQLATIPVHKWMEIAKAEFEVEVINQVNIRIRGRAFTSARRRRQQ